MNKTTVFSKMKLV